MNNKQIARIFDLLGSLMELHNDNPFKIKSYKNAYLTLRKVESPLFDLEKDELIAIPGIGTTIADKIIELKLTGTLELLEKFKDKTPSGVIDMFQVKGLGPKKVLTIWKDLGIESLGELLYACNENQLIKAKGFGEKIQFEVKKNIEFFEQSKDKILWSAAELLIKEIHTIFNIKESESFKVVGEFSMLHPIINKLEFLSSIPIALPLFDEESNFVVLENNKELIHLLYNGRFNIHIYFCTSSQFESQYFEKTSTSEFLEFVSQYNQNIVEYSRVSPELRSHFIANTHFNPHDIVQLNDIKGIIHNHSTYSDGLHSLSDMVAYVLQAGFEYFLITDHSQSAFYANGLSIERVLQQQREIDELNIKYAGKLRILKGIESDILNNGNLDYPDDILATFDVIVSSIHSNLKMQEAAANIRLIKAIENPYTHILGHPTSRLLLGRNGYPINHEKIIDACAANNVCIELNANPQRLDLDYSYVEYAMNKGVHISINPDAHNKESIHYIRYGLNVARLGGLTKSFCINTYSCDEFLDKLKK
jgi:DNA polymerase (family X)